MDQNRNEKKSSLNNAGLCAAMGVTLLLLGVGGYFLLRDPGSAPAPVPETTLGEEVPARGPEHELPSVPPASAPVRVPETPKTPAAKGDAPEAMPEVEPEPMTVPEEAAEPEPDAPTLVVSPIQGEVISAFSADELSYNETLGDWRTHEGVDLAAAVGDTVLSAAAGTVQSVRDDPLMGTTVTIAHDGGYETTYANLQDQAAVLAGDEVAAGQIIGLVGETAAVEASQPPHLHFGVTRDGESVDPEEFLNP